jgi:hypothetical protein
VTSTAEQDRTDDLRRSPTHNVSFWDNHVDAERGIQAAAPTARTMLAGLGTTGVLFR